MDVKQLLFAGYANIAIMEMRLYNSQNEPLRPTHKEILYLYSIWSRGSCTASELVELFDSSKALVSQTILALEQKGYIIRTRDPVDNRKQIITINEEGLNEGVEELYLIERSVKQLSSRYTEGELMDALRIVLDLTDEIMEFALLDAKKRF